MLTIGLVLVLVAVTSAVHGAVGFGMNLLAVPVLLVLDRSFVPGPTLAAGLLLSVLVAAREPTAWDRRLGWAVAGLVPGIGVALLVLSAVSPPDLGAPLGGLVLVAVVMSALPIRLSPTRRALAVAGVASGFLATAGSLGGPPLALVYAESSGARLRSNLSAFFVVAAGLSLVALVAAGQYGRDDLGPSLLLVPPVLVGFAASARLQPVLDRGHTHAAVLVLSAAAGVAAVVAGISR